MDGHGRYTVVTIPETTVSHTSSSSSYIGGCGSWDTTGASQTGQWVSPGVIVTAPALGDLLCGGAGHEMGDEVEFDDGSIRGRCIHCDVEIRGRRLPGGIGVLRLKHALVDLYGADEGLPELLAELHRVEDLLALEQHELDVARRMLELARHAASGRLHRKL